MVDSGFATITAALIGAASGSIIGPLIKDFFIQKLTENRSRAAKQEEIFRNYAAPLAASSEKLLWRFNEILLEKRHQFLKADTLPFVYNEYKRTSTLYRIASVLGWIRAMNLEMSALPQGNAGFSVPISAAIKKIQCALADGPHVEVHRLEQVCKVWGINLNMNDSAKAELAAKFEIRLYHVAGDTLKHDSEHLSKISPEDKLRVCEALGTYLCDYLHRSALSPEIVAETVGRAIGSLSYREALIYRDWQDAISDLVLEPDPASVRRFKIIGFAKFDEVLKSQSLWIEVFRDMLIDIDLETVNPNDFRSNQLRELSSGIASLVISLSKSKERGLVGADILAKAHTLEKLPAKPG